MLTEEIFKMAYRENYMSLVYLDIKTLPYIFATLTTQLHVVLICSLYYCYKMEVDFIYIIKSSTIFQEQFYLSYPQGQLFKLPFLAHR